MFTRSVGAWGWQFVKSVGPFIGVVGEAKNHEFITLCFSFFGDNLSLHNYHYQIPLSVPRYPATIRTSHNYAKALHNWDISI